MFCPPRSVFVMLRLVGLVAVLALLSCKEKPGGPAGAISVAIKTVPADWREYGDAPDGAATLYREGTAVGQFPTKAASGGPVHELSGKVWLGFTVSPEGEPRYRDSDDGVLHLQLNPCAQSFALVLVNTGGLTAAERAAPVYLNLFFDWNRDGRWEGKDACGQEWAVQNLPVDVSKHDEGNPFVVLDVPFTAGQQTQEFWYRAMVTRRQVGPRLGSFPDGETEDYVYQQALTFSARPGLFPAPSPPTPEQPTFACQGGIMRHGTAEVEFKITQTEESQGRVVSGGVATEFRLSGPLAVGEPGAPRPGELREANVAQNRIGRDRLELTVRARLSHPEDDPRRIEGPFTLVVRIAGSFTGTQRGTFWDLADCGYYVDHLTGAGYYLFPGEFIGAPQTDPELRPNEPLPGLLVIPHGQTGTLSARDDAGRYSLLRILQGDTNWRAVPADQAALAAGGTRITLAIRGRGLRVATRRDPPDRLEWFMVIAEGEDRNRQYVADVYRFLVLHGPRDLVERHGPFFTEAPMTPAPAATATATPTPTVTPTPTATATSTATPPSVVGCILGIDAALRGINIVPGEYHEAEIRLQAFNRDILDRTEMAAFVRISLEAHRSDGQVTRGTVTTNERGEATARMRTTAFGQNTLRVTNAEKEGCTWAQRDNPPSLTWEARP